MVITLDAILNVAETWNSHSLGATFRPSLHVPDQKSVALSAGQLLTLAYGVRHDVEALEESAFLLTVAWPKGTAKP